MSEDICCGTCVSYKPSEIEGWGVCQVNDLWLVRLQEVPADLHACASRGSRWASTQAKPAPNQNEQRAAQTSPPATSSSHSPEAKTEHRPVGAPNPIPNSPTRPISRTWLWLVGAGVLGILVSPLILIFDLLIGIPGLPEITIIVWILCIVLIIAGLITRSRERVI